jgi:hypothetical protein
MTRTDEMRLLRGSSAAKRCLDRGLLTQGDPPRHSDGDSDCQHGAGGLARDANGRFASTRQTAKRA